MQLPTKTPTLAVMKGRPAAPARNRPSWPKPTLRSKPGTNSQFPVHHLPSRKLFPVNNGWAKERMRWQLLVLTAAGLFVGDCQCQEQAATNHSGGATNSVPSLQTLAVGTWRCTVPAEQDGTNTFLKVHLSADGSWSWSVHSDKPRADPNKQSGTWFVHERVLVLRVGDSNTRLFHKMAFTFDIKSFTPQTLALTNSPLGDVTWTRIAQRDGAANGSQPIRSEATGTSGAAGSRR